MPYYRYYTIDPRAGTPVLELPLYGTYMDKVINGAGNFTGTFKLRTGVYNDSNLIDGTRPGRYGLVCKRDEVPVWAGMVWSRTYGSDANTVQLTGQTFESIFQHITFMANFGSPSTEQVVAYQDFLTFMDTMSSSALNFNFDFDVTYPSTGINRSFQHLKHTLTTNFLDEMSGYQDGLSYTVNLFSGSNDNLVKRFQLVSNSTPPDSGMYFDFPGTVKKYWYNENASRAGVRHIVRAIDVSEGSSAPTVEVVNTDLVTDGYVPWHNLQNLNDIPNITQLTAQANKIATDLKMPLASPTFELGSNSLFTGWNNVGETFKVRVQDARFPSGEIFSSRLNGWSLTPEASGSEEIIRLVLQGET